MKTDNLILTNMDDFAGYLKDESRLTGTAVSISFPENPDHIREILSILRKDHTSITIQGARTGITGGAVPQGNHILNTGRMNRIISFSGDAKSNEMFVRVQPGLVLSELRRLPANQPETASLFFPPDPTETSASIGGMISCNASGARSFLYGPTRKYIEGLKVMLVDGSLISLKRGGQKAIGRNFSLALENGKKIEGALPSYIVPAVKSASGYFVRDDMDLIDLFIGAEGTLGIIVEAEIRLIAKPRYIWSLICFFPGWKNSIGFVRNCRGDADAHLPVHPAAIEFFDDRSLGLLSRMKQTHAAFSSLPVIPENAYGVYLEFHSDKENLLDETILLIPDIVSKYKGSDDVWCATEPREAEKLSAFRHAIPEAVNLLIDEKKKQGLIITKLGTDMAAGNDRLEEIYSMYMETLAESKLDYVIFGHIGDNHLHVNILPKSGEEYDRGKILYKTWAKKIADSGGSVSAEHGIGKLKPDFLCIMFGDRGVSEMRALKKFFDPLAMLNPGNLFEQDREAE